MSMRRTLRTLPCLTLLLSGLCMGGSSGVAAASGSTDVWKLVNRTCVNNQQTQEVEAGRACFDPQGHMANWDNVGEDAASSKVAGAKEDYTYKLPDVIAAGQDNKIELSATVSQVTDGGAHARVCETGGFAHREQGDPCATTAEAPNGESASASAGITQIPGEAAPGQIVTVMVSFEEPGGTLYFSYRADGHKTTVTYQFDGREHDPQLHQVRLIDAEGKGTFTVVGPLRYDMEGESESGSAKIVITKDSGATHTVHLTLRRALFNAPQEADLFYRVTQSTVKCAPVGRQVEVELFDGSSPVVRVCKIGSDFTRFQDDVHHD
jgi:hypothetical protein